MGKNCAGAALRADFCAGIEYLSGIERTIYYLEYPLPDGSLLVRLLPNDDHLLVPDRDALREQLHTEFRKEALANARALMADKRIELKLLSVSTVPVRNHERRLRLMEAGVPILLPTVRWQRNGVWQARAYFPDSSFKTIYGDRVGQVHTWLREYAASYFSHHPPHEVLAAVRMTPPTLEKIALDLSGVPPRVKRRQDTSELSTYAFRYDPKRSRANVPDLLIGRDPEVERVQKLLMSGRGSVLLAGESRVGKSAILRRAWSQLDEDTRQPGLWILDPAHFERDVEHFGDYQKNVNQLVEAVEASGGVLWFQNMDALLLSKDRGSAQPVLIMNYLATFLRAGRLRILAETTPEQRRILQRRSPDLMAAFTLVSVEPMNDTRGMRVLLEVADAYRKQRKFFVAPEATRRIHRLMVRFYRDRSFPGKSVRFLHDAVAHQRRRKQTQLTERDVLDYFHHATGLPASISDEFQTHDPREHFAGRIVGQARAVEVLTQTVHVFRAGINDPGKPVRVLLFAGPTGVGKTESVVALAEYFYGPAGRNRLLRIDMSEYHHPYRVRRLVGEGSTAGPLVERVREQPFTIILLDEIEKAHPSVWTTLMTLFDEGTLTDAAGRTTDFSNTIIVLTSNLGSNEARGVQLGGTSRTDQRFLGAIHRELPPEVRNRIDETVVFQPLRPEHMQRIGRLELERYAQRPGFTERNLRLAFTESVVAEVARRGYDPERGARALRQVVDRSVGRQLNDLLFREPTLADRTLRLDWVEGELVVHVE